MVQKILMYIKLLLPYVIAISISLLFIPYAMYDRFIRYGYLAIGGEFTFPIYAIILVYSVKVCYRKLRRWKLSAVSSIETGGRKETAKRIAQ